MRTDANRSEQVNIDGFGDFLNHNIIAMEFFKGNLYAGTWNESEGIQIWRATPGPSIPFPSWEKVSEDGFGAGAANGFSNFMVTSGVNLYVVGQGGAGSPGFVFKRADGATWEEVNGPGWSPVGSAAGAYWATVFQEKVYVRLPPRRPPRLAVGDRLTADRFQIPAR
jgi:hypothetical protein